MSQYFLLSLHQQHSNNCILNEQFLQLTDLLHVLQITFADIRPGKSIKKKEQKI